MLSIFLDVDIIQGTCLSSGSSFVRDAVYELQTVVLAMWSVYEYTIECNGS